MASGYSSRLFLGEAMVSVNQTRLYLYVKLIWRTKLLYIVIDIYVSLSIIHFSTRSGCTQMQLPARKALNSSTCKWGTVTRHASKNRNFCNLGNQGPRPVTQTGLGPWFPIYILCNSTCLKALIMLNQSAIVFNIRELDKRVSSMLPVIFTETDMKSC